MMSLTKMILVVFCYMIIFSNNPVKTSMFLLLSSSILFFWMYYDMGSTWFPMIFFMMFMGGILIVFMILSSITPNEKTKKMKILNILMLIFILSSSLAMNLMNNSIMQMSQQIKWFMYSNHNIYMALTLIGLYFFLFVKVLSKEKSPMRTETCY